MIVRVSGLLVGAAAAIALWAGSASAQTTVEDLTEAQEDELYCVYDRLEDDFELVAEQFLYDDLPEEEAKKATAALDAAGNTCAATYSWDDKKRDHGKNLARFGSVTDYLEEDLYFEGVKDEDIDKIYSILGRLPDAELSKFLDVSWLDDKPFIERLNAALAAGGFPKGDDDFQFETARLLMEVTVLGAVTFEQWAEAYLR
jgi:hypothetical protein